MSTCRLALIHMDCHKFVSVINRNQAFPNKDAACGDDGNLRRSWEIDSDTKTFFSTCFHVCDQCVHVNSIKSHHVCAEFQTSWVSCLCVNTNNKKRNPWTTEERSGRVQRLAIQTSIGIASAGSMSVPSLRERTILYKKKEM